MRSWILAIGSLCAAGGAMAQAPVSHAPQGMAAGTHVHDAMPAMPQGYTGSPFEGMPQASGPAMPTSWVNSAWMPFRRWEWSLEAVWFLQDFPTSDPLFLQYQAVDNIFVATPVGVGVGDQHTFAPRAVVQFRPNECWSIYWSGFFIAGPDQRNSPIGQVDQTLYVSAAGPSAEESGFMTNLPAAFPTIADQVTLDWTNDVYNTDFELRRHIILPHGPISDMSLGFGVRYFGLYERADVAVSDILVGTTGGLRSGVDNTAIGPQLSALFRVQTPFCWLRLTAEGKIGLLANGIENRMSVIDATGAVAASGQYRRTQFAPLFEGNFLAEFYLRHNVSIYGGYQMIYLDRVERAGDQFQPDVIDFISRRDDIGTVFLHGPKAGITVTY